MVKINKKGQEEFTPAKTVASIVLIIMLLLGAFYLIKRNQEKVKDATEDVSSWVNFANPNCDFDKDGIKNPLDICPCDSDSELSGRIYYLKNSQCKVVRVPSYEKIEYDKKQIACETSATACPAPLKAESDSWVYVSYPLADKTCSDAVSKILKDNLIVSSTICTIDEFNARYPEISIDGKSTKFYQLTDLTATSLETIAADKRTSELLFSEKCATRILAQNAEKGRATFTCATPTIECRKKIQEEKCV